MMMGPMGPMPMGMQVCTDGGTEAARRVDCSALTLISPPELVRWCTQLLSRYQSQFQMRHCAGCWTLSLYLHLSPGCQSQTFRLCR